VADRQWVLTLPWKRRGLLVYKPDLVGGLLGVVIDVLSRWYRREVPQEKTGAVTAIHRFDSALRHNLHFHILMPDGAWVGGLEVGGELLTLTCGVVAYQFDPAGSEPSSGDPRRAGPSRPGSNHALMDRNQLLPLTSAPAR
jgi:hypothetical protein